MRCPHRGSLTVFAPNQTRHSAALPHGVLDGLLADTDALTNVLTYHVSGSLLPGLRPDRAARPRADASGAGSSA